jgi:hypothetical protein
MTRTVLQAIDIAGFFKDSITDPRIRLRAACGRDHIYAQLTEIALGMISQAVTERVF